MDTTEQQLAVPSTHASVPGPEPIEPTVPQQPEPFPEPAPDGDPLPSPNPGHEPVPPPTPIPSPDPGPIPDPAPQMRVPLVMAAEAGQSTSAW